MKKLFLLLKSTFLQLSLLLFCCFFASCKPTETEKNNSENKIIEDSVKNISENTSKNSTEKIDTNNKKTTNSDEKSTEKSTEKTPQKLDTVAFLAKLSKKWQITGNYWVSSIETFNNNENYFLDLQKDGSYTLKAHLEDVGINETGKWKLQNPKIKFRKFDETDPKDAGVPIEDNEEILILMPKNSNNNKERLFLFSFDEKEFAFNTLSRPSGLFAK